MLQNPIIQFSLQYLSRGRLREVKNKRKFQTLGLKVVVVDCKREVSNILISLLVFWYFGKLVTEEKWFICSSII